MSHYVKIGYITLFLAIHLSTLIRLYKRGKGFRTAEISELTMLVLLNMGMAMTYQSYSVSSVLNFAIVLLQMPLQKKYIYDNLQRIRNEMKKACPDEISKMVMPNATKKRAIFGYITSSAITLICIIISK